MSDGVESERTERPQAEFVFAEANVSPRNLSSYEIRHITFLKERVNKAIKTKTINLYDVSF